MLAAVAAAGCSGGDDGAAGAPGPAGERGATGAQGSGEAALVAVTAEPAGANCATGGQRIATGLDANGDGVLGPAEVENTTYVCNGADAPAGAAGAAGAAGGGQSALVAVTAEPAGDNCVTGGHAIASGIDDNADGVLDAVEVDSTAYVCNSEIPVAGESCAVCHSPGKIADVSEIHPDPVATPLTVTITAVQELNNDGTGVLQVDFTLTDDQGDGVEGIAFGGNRFYVSDIVPAGTVTAQGTWDTDYLERWAYERDSGSYPTGTWQELTGGDYRYTFATPIADATVNDPDGTLGYGVDKWGAPDFDLTHVQRVIVRVDGRADGYTRTIGIQDVQINATAAAETLLAPQRVIAPADGCKNCHSSRMEEAAHAGGYLEPRACVQCHSPLGDAYGDEMQTDGAWLTPLIHQLHAGIDIPAFPDRINDQGYAGVHFPRPISDCQACHTGNEGMTDAWQSNPSIEACGTCHNNVNFAVDDGSHAGGVQTDNAMCAACHNATAIADYHTPAPAAVDVPEFQVTLDVEPPSNGSFYRANEMPHVTVTLAHPDGSPIDPAFYTTPRGDAGVTDDTALRVASVYIYGPRASAEPVLAYGTKHHAGYDPADPPTQGHLLFTGGTDGRVRTDATGFRYRLMPIPADIEPGTYMVRVRIADYGRVEAGDYRIESTAFTTIQIGTATPSLKLAGDACMDCHGPGNFTPHNERHSVVFDTDECLSCHDGSGNYAVPIWNRVHAIHSANTQGDLYYVTGHGTRDWDHVAFPQDAASCVACHTSGNDTYQTKPAAAPCAGCHVEDGNGVVDHLRQNGAGF